MNNIIKYFILLILVIDLSANEPLQKVSLQLKWKYQFQFAGFLIAKEKGFYKDVGLDVDIKELEKDIDIVDEVINQNIEFGVSDSSLIYEALKEKPVLAMMAIYQHTPFVLIGLKESGIETLQGINGKKLALHKGIDGIAIKTMLKTNNINYVPQAPAFSLDRLLSKKIDFMTAYISNEPIIAKKQGIELISFSPEDYGFEGYGDILFTSKKFHKKNPAQVKKMYMASFKGWQYAYENIDEAIDIIYNKYNSLNKTKEELKDEALVLKKLSDFHTNFGELDIEKVKGIAQQFNIVKEEYNKLNILDDFIYELNKKTKNYSKKVNVLLGFDKPPFIFGKTSSKGIDSDVLVEAFNIMGYNVSIFQGTKDQQETILHKHNTIIDAVATISKKEDGLFYSDTFSTYENYIITRKKDNIKIDSLEDLKNYKFVTWKSAFNDLGDEFNKLYNPYTGKYKESYNDTPSQRNDAKMFFSKKVDAIIVDKAIFLWHKLHFNNDEEYDFHDVFNDKKHYPVTFKDKKIRDDFNIGLKKLKSSGRYNEILKFYETQNVEELLTFANILSNISSRYFFEEKKIALKKILGYFFNHPDIKAITINKNNQKNFYINLVKDKNQIKSNMAYDFTNLPKVSKKIYYSNQNDLLELGELSVYYKKEYKTKNGQLIPKIEKLKNLDKNTYSNIEKIYKKFNILKNTDEKLNTKFDFIQNHKPIKVCFAKTMEPFMFEDKNKAIGLSKDYLDIISRNMGISFEYILADSIPKHYEMIKDNKCDIVPTILREPNKFDFLIPTEPYIFDYIALATRLHEPYETDLSSLKDKKIGINKGLTNIIFYLKKKYPNINFIQVNDNGLEMVKKGELYGYAEPALMLSYKILNRYPNDLKIMKSLTERKLEGSVGINKNKAYLLEPFNDAIEQITAQERSNITGNWKKIHYDKEIDYTYIWYTLIISFIILSIIITAYIKQNRLRKEIEIQRDKFENIFNNAKDGILICTNDKFTDCNKSIIEILGFKNKRDILNLNLVQISPKYQIDEQKSYEKSKNMISHAIKEGHHNFEWLYQKVDKSISWADITITNISTDEDEILHIVLRDISDKKKLQEELEEINQTLQDKVDLEVEKNKEQQLMIIKQNRLAQMGEMISMIAHQWRQPLNNLSILNNTLILKYSKNKLDDDIVQRFKENSKKQIELMSKTIDDFRNFFKPNKEKISFELIKVIENSLDILKPLFTKHNININIKYESEISIKGYQNEVGQALLNIFNNSIDALLENNIKDKNINIVICDDEKYVFMELSDNAGGIKEQYINKIFDPYFSTKVEKNGTGLGLYMTKTIIEDHMNGEIKVSNNDDGVLFKIRFLK